MKVLIDAHMVGEQETGNETYVANLVKALSALATSDEFVLAVTDPAAFANQIELKRKFAVCRVSANPIRRLVFDLPRIIRNASVDVIHSTYTAPLPCKCALVLTIHDMAYKRNPEWFSPRDRAVLTFGIGMSVPRARFILAISKHAKQDICRFLDMPEAKVVVTHVAAGSQYTPADDREREWPGFTRMRISKPYMLAVGNLQPRKNLIRLIRAFGAIKKNAGIPHQLVLAGKTGWRESEIHDLLQNEPFASSVIPTGFVPQADLPHLYRGADLFVYPSLCEGFGLPILEAMACGTPVVTSNVSALPEVAGGAAVLIDPLDVHNLTEGIISVLLDEGKKEELVKKGLRRAAEFSWQRTAEQTLEIYRQAAFGQQVTTPPAVPV